MSTNRKINQILHAIALLLIVSVTVSQAQPLDATFTYQGKLKYQSQLANGSFDFQFELYDVSIDGTTIANTIQLEDVTVNQGVFIVDLDFIIPSNFETQSWLAISVREGASNAVFTLLSPRDKINPAPYALHTESLATNAVGINEIDANQIQLRVKQSCDPNTSIQSIDINGGVTCQDDVLGLTTVSSQDIVNGTITVKDIDNNSLQQRITGTCPSDQYLININQDGSVICRIFPYPDN